MKVRLLKDWGFNKAGDVVEVFDPTGNNWILNGIAEIPREVRSVEPVEQAVSPQPESVERAMKKYRR
jgi:hypothetical protein